MCALLFHCVPQLAIYDVDGTYGGAQKGQMSFESQDWQLLRDNIEFHKEVVCSDEEVKQMEVLKWLHLKKV